MNAAFASSGFSTTSFSPSAFAFDLQKKKKGGGGSPFYDGYAARLKLARMDQQDLLDIVCILGLITAELDEM